MTAILLQVHAQGISYNYNSSSCWLAIIATESDVGLSLKGAPIANNSYVDVDDIDEGDYALLCHTNKTNCCEKPNTN